MGAAGDRRRRRHRTFVAATALGTLVALVAAGGRDRSPPPPLPDLPPAGRDDLTLTVDAERDGGGVRVDVALAVDRLGDVLTVRAWDDGSLVGERLEHGQVVVHVGLVSAGPDVPEGVSTYALPRPPPPVLVLPGSTLDATVTYDGGGPEVDGVTPAGSDDVRRIDEVRVCVWSERDAGSGATTPTVCADADVGVGS